VKRQVGQMSWRQNISSLNPKTETELSFGQFRKNNLPPP
jgi:hypothetical protein